MLACSFDPLGGVRPVVDGEALDGDELALVVGSHLSLCLEPAHDWSRSVSDTHLRSSDPSVAAAEPGPCPAVIQAGATPGRSRLDLVEGEHVRWSLPIRVEQPDVIGLTPLGPKLLRSELPPPDPRPGILAGGAALFLATPSAGGTPLRGGEWVQGVEGDGAHTVGWSASANTLFHDGVALWVDADTEPGPRTVPVSVGGQRMELPFIVRAPEEVASFEVQGPIARSVLFIPYGFLLAQGRTATGEIVHGLPVQWRFRDDWKPRTGVAFRFTRHDDYPGTVRARWGDFEAAVDVAGTGGTVVDPPTQACASAPGRAGGVLALLATLLLVARLRRREHAVPLVLATTTLATLAPTVARADGAAPTPGAVRTKLRGPKGLDRFEPSAAVVVGDQLCVGSDKPLKWGGTRASVWSCYALVELDGGKDKPDAGGVIPGAGKLEGATALADGSTAWWDAREQRLWTCQGPTCQVGAAPDLGVAAALAAGRVCKVKVEGVATAPTTTSDGGLWLGVRGFELEHHGGCDHSRFDPHGAILDARGRLLWEGGGLPLDPDHDGHGFGISGMDTDASGQRLWLTWSYEGEGHGVDSVAGRLAWLPLQGGRLLPNAPLHICVDDTGAPRALQGKPEALVVRADGFLVAYDNDDERKRADAFDLRQDEDYVERLPLDWCAQDRVTTTP